MPKNKKAPTRRDVRGAPRVQDMLEASRIQNEKNEASGYVSPQLRPPTAADVIAAVGHSKQQQKKK